MAKQTIICNRCGREQKIKDDDRIAMRADGWEECFFPYQHSSSWYRYCPECTKSLKRFRADMERREKEFIDEREQPNIF